MKKKTKYTFLFLRKGRNAIQLHNVVQQQRDRGKKGFVSKELAAVISRSEAQGETGVKA